MKASLLPLLAFALPLIPLSGSAALVWVNHDSNLLYKSVFRWANIPEPAVMQGTLPSHGGVTTTYTATNGYWFENGYKGSGSRIWYRPGYDAGALAVPDSAYGLPSAPGSATLSAAGYFNSQVTATSDFTGLSGGELPAGSWIYLRFEDFAFTNYPQNGDAVLTVESVAGWNDAVWLPGGPSGTSLVSSTPEQLVLQGKGEVWLRTSMPLASLTWTVSDPTPFLDSNSGQATSKVEATYGIVANIPEPSVTVTSLLAAGALLARRGRRTIPAHTS